MNDQMINCLAIDDEPLALRQLSEYIKKIPFLNLLGMCQSAVEAQSFIQKEQVDAIFIDINMPDLNGLEFVRSLNEPPIVVFTTAYSDYAIDGYKVNAVDYLLKPFGFDEFKAAADKVKQLFDLMHTPTSMSVDENDAIYLKSEYKIVRVDLNDIRYIEAMSEYLRIYRDSSPRPVITLLSMKKMEDRLPSSSFMRIHRSYIINLKKIVEVSKSHVVMGEEESFPIGDLYKDAFMNYLNRRYIAR